ncbi:MAG: oxygen-insensitive NAD(P)H nitroreductase [Rikenellaceae bacterium]
MDIIKILESRYSAKEFDPTKEIDAQMMDKLKVLLQKSPSSTNIQPWHFVIATTREGKERIAKSTHGFFAFNEKKVLDAAAVVIFSTRVTADEDYMQHLSDREDVDGRFANEEFKRNNHTGRAIFADLHKYDRKDQQHWFEKQTYLNLGVFLLGVAALGLDAVPMEGCDTTILNSEFDLAERGFTASFIVAVGYRAESDFNASLPKSRLTVDEIIEMV